MTKVWTGCKTWLGQGQDNWNGGVVEAANCPITTSGNWFADDPQEALLIGPAERPDVIVDFTGLEAGTVVRMINTAPDAPFGGFPDVPADPDTTGQVMQFVVNPDLANPAGDPSTPPAQLRLALPDETEWNEVGPIPVSRDMALLEEESAQICVDINATTGEITQVVGSVPPDCVGWRRAVWSEGRRSRCQWPRRR